MAKTAIEWTDRSWNPTKGCSKVSQGCVNCYAMTMARRLEAMGNKHYRGLTKTRKGKLLWTGKIAIDHNAISQPLGWTKPSRVFVNSMSDLFHEDIPSDTLLKIWKVMDQTPQHNYQILTKRPEQMLKVLSQTDEFPVLKNVWLGVSVEDHTTVDRLDLLRRVPASVRFVSLEPLLGPTPDIDLSEIDWAIVGGESGPRSRAIEKVWIEEIFDACRHHGTAFFFKQWGGVNKKKTGRIFNGQEWNEYPVIT